MSHAQYVGICDRIPRQYGLEFKGQYNIEILYLLTLNGVLHNRDSMTGNKGVT